ncbi:MAG: T9SS type A sorting domain-containing protein [Draconibacterium sp.]|nr:T9SS type A sorting domain-containing protein [Draconibacterium sp.]
MYSIKEFNTYQWLLNGSKINNATQRKYVISASGEYALEVTDENNCWLISESVNVVKSDPGSNDTVFTFICPSNLTIDCADNFPQPFTNLANFVSAGGLAISTPSPVDESTFAWENDVSNNKTCPEKITRTYSIQNENGDILKCEQRIYVSDTEYPKLVMGNKIVSCPDDKPMIYTNKVQFEAELGNSASDNCGLDWTTFKFNSQVTDGNYCSEISVRSYEIKDMCGNSMEASEYIIVEDLIPPSLKCPSDVSYNAGLDNMKDFTGLAYSETEKQILSSSYTQLDILVSDNCLIEKVTYNDIISGFCPIKISRNFSAIDACGNTSTCIQKIELTKGITLSETHENDGADNLNTGKINLEVSWGVPPYLFQWSNGETTEDIENLPSGSYQVEVQDSNGCTDSLVINIESVLASVSIICPSSLTISCKKDIDQSVYSDFNEFIAAGGSAFSECGIDTGTFVWAGDEIVDGSGCLNIDRTYEVYDSCGTKAFCVQSILINDEVAPVLTCPSKIAVVGEIKPEYYESYSAFAAAGGFADDNCEIDESSFKWINDSSDEKTNPETLTRTYQIADFCENVASSVQTIKLYDNSGIFINCPPDMTILCSENKPDTPLTYADFIAEGGNAGSFPDFPIVESSFQVETVENNDLDNCKEFITRKYSIMNKNDDLATCEQQIVIIKPSASTLTCPPDISLNKNENIPDGSNSLNEFIIAGGNFSNECGSEYDLFYSFSEYKDTIVSPNLVERTYFITDKCGSNNLCIQQISIESTTQSINNERNDNFNIKVFPNPTKGKFSFEAEGIINKEISLTIYNSIGDRILQDLLTTVNGRLNKDMDLSDVASGVYYIKITDGNKSDTRSIIVE